MQVTSDIDASSAEVALENNRQATPALWSHFDLFKDAISEAAIVDGYAMPTPRKMEIEPEVVAPNSTETPASDGGSFYAGMFNIMPTVLLEMASALAKTQATSLSKEFVEPDPWDDPKMFNWCPRPECTRSVENCPNKKFKTRSMLEKHIYTRSNIKCLALAEQLGYVLDPLSPKAKKATKATPRGRGLSEADMADLTS